MISHFPYKGPKSGTLVKLVGLDIKMIPKTMLFVLVAGAVTAVVTSVPLHASCKLTWNFNKQCPEVKEALVAQITKWAGLDVCPETGEKCGYKLVNSSENEIKATHMTPVKKYVDDLTMTFSQSGNSCTVEGYSTSETWYAFLDYGTNYCNLHNLLTGSGLDQGSTETTSNSICTQYTSANCAIY